MRRLLMMILFFVACGPSREILYQKYEKEKAEKLRRMAMSFVVRIECADRAVKVVGEETLREPYEFIVEPGKVYSYTLRFDKVSYTGEIYVKEYGGDYGKYPGYGICFSKELRRYVDEHKIASFFIKSPEGRKIIQVVIRRE